MGSLPWNEKYRPKYLPDVVGNSAAVERMKVIAFQGNIPNLLLTGPPGTGKTTSLLCLARQLLGQHFSEALIELNASDDRGIEVVRQTIKSFAKRHITLPASRHKIILLDEADSMTDAAQQAMRRIMEKFSNTTRFVFACNQSEKVIEALQSRCAIVRFTRVSESEIAPRLEKICTEEDIHFTKDGIDALAVMSDGDMRTAINGLQATAVRFGTITLENVEHSVEIPNPALIENIFENLKNKQLREAMGLINTLIEEGHSSSEIVQTMFRVIRKSDKFPDKTKLYLLKEIGLMQMHISQGFSSQLQLNGMLSRLFLIFIKP